METLLKNIYNLGNKKELLTFITYSICVLFILWFAFSYIDIVTNNMSSCEYSRLNFFTMFS